MTGSKQIKTFAVLGNHLPRQCGIATFTTHLADALEGELPDAAGFVLAMNDAGRRHAYPSRVRFEITEADLVSYRRAADFLNANHVDVLSVQHEYGIFGGKAGAHLLGLLQQLRMPIVTVLTAAVVVRAEVSADASTLSHTRDRPGPNMQTPPGAIARWASDGVYAACPVAPTREGVRGCGAWNSIVLDREQ